LQGPAGARRGAALEHLDITPDGAVLIRDGLVRDLGPSRRLEAMAEVRDAIEIHAAGRVVMPGFVDGHTRPIAGALPAPAAWRGRSVLPVRV